MSGWLRIIGIGAGKEQWLTPEAHDWLQRASDIVGYTPYVEAINTSITAKRHASDNGQEIERARFALQLAAQGARVAVVSGGDAGIFGMASAVFEAIDTGDAQWRNLDIEVIPGISALLAAAARIGAPLGHDFCVMSLSDYLKPWEVIQRRLRTASEGDFVLVLYNPASKTRRNQLSQALQYLQEMRGGDTIVMLAKSVGRPQEEIHITTLADIDAAQVDMRCLLIIGSSKTRAIARRQLRPFIYTPRFYE